MPGIIIRPVENGTINQMKISKPEYNENVVDVDALEKHRIHELAETDRLLILEQEKTKRENMAAQEETKRGDGYAKLRTTIIIVIGIILAIVAGGAWSNGYSYLEVLKMRVDLAKKPDPVCAPPPKCPELTCQAVQVKN